MGRPQASAQVLCSPLHGGVVLSPSGTEVCEEGRWSQVSAEWCPAGSTLMSWTTPRATRKLPNHRGDNRAVLLRTLESQPGIPGTVFDLAANPLFHPKSESDVSHARGPTEGEARAPGRLWLEGEGWGRTKAWGQAGSQGGAAGRWGLPCPPHSCTDSSAPLPPPPTSPAASRGLSSILGGTMQSCSDSGSEI